MKSLSSLFRWHKKISMKNLVPMFLFVSISLVSCSKKDCKSLINFKEKKITFVRKEKENTHKLNFYFSGKSSCDVKASVIIDKKPYLNLFIYKGKIDTTLSTDWYSNQVEIQIESEECLIEKLDVCCSFLSI